MVEGTVPPEPLAQLCSDCRTRVLRCPWCGQSLKSKAMSRHRVGYRAQARGPARPVSSGAALHGAGHLESCPQGSDSHRLNFEGRRLASPRLPCDAQAERASKLKSSLCMLRCCVTQARWGHVQGRVSGAPALVEQ